MCVGKVTVPSTSRESAVCVAAAVLQLHGAGLTGAQLHRGCAVCQTLSGMSSDSAFAFTMMQENH